MTAQPAPSSPKYQVEPASESLGWALHHLAVASAALDAVVAQQLGLSSTDYLAMKHLLNAEHHLGPADLARLLGMSTGSATALIDRLQQAGHVKRQPHPNDRRRLIIEPTPSSTTSIVAALHPLADKIDDLSGQFTPGEIATIHRFLSAATHLHTNYPGLDAEKA